MTQRCTVVIPTRNRLQRLQRTLATIRAQDHPDLEIVVSDDGSTDGTPEALADIDDPRLRVVGDGQQRGVSVARNRGVEIATGTWVAFCDDDDLWHHSKLSNQLAALSRTGRNWSYCSALKVDDQFNPLAVDVADHGDLLPIMGFVNGVPGGCSTVVARRDLVRDLGGFSPDLSMFADWDLWIRLAGQGEAAAIDQLAVLYVQHGQQMSLDLNAITTELSRFRARHTDLRRHPPPRSVDGVDVWISDRLRLSGRRLTAVGHSGRNLHRLDRYALRMLARAALGPRPITRSSIWTRFGVEAEHLVAGIRTPDLPPLA